MGCVTPLTDDEVGAVLRRTANGGSGANVMTFFASSDAEALVRVVEARSNGPLPESRRLALGFEGAAHKRLRYVVGGPYARLNDRALLDAFTLCKESRLPGLEVLFVSPAPPSEELDKTARAYGARLVHRAYEDGR
jgi:hypothetical protein